MEKPNKEKKFSDFGVRLYLGIGRLGSDDCDRMIIDHRHGNSEDVGICNKGGERIAAWWRTALALFPSSSPAAEILNSGAWSLEPMDPEDQKRILEIYDLMKSGP